MWHRCHLLGSRRKTTKSETYIAGGAGAGVVIHEYAGICDADRDYRYSRQIYENPTLKFYLGNLDWTLPPNQSQELDFPITCELLDHEKNVPDALGYVGPGVFSSAGSTSTVFFTARKIRDTKQGLLVVSVDTGADPVTQMLGTFKSSVKRPLVRISVGYGAQFMGPPLRPVVQQDLRVTGDFDALVQMPQEGIQIHCRRFTKKDLMAQLFPQSTQEDCGKRIRDTEPLPPSVQNRFTDLSKKIKAR